MLVRVCGHTAQGTQTHTTNTVQISNLAHERERGRDRDREIERGTNNLFFGDLRTLLRFVALFIILILFFFLVEKINVGLSSVKLGVGV